MIISVRTTSIKYMSQEKELFRIHLLSARGREVGEGAENQVGALPATVKRESRLYLKYGTETYECKHRYQTNGKGDNW